MKTYLLLFILAVTCFANCKKADVLTTKEKIIGKWKYEGTTDNCTTFTASNIMLTVEFNADNTFIITNASGTCTGKFTADDTNFIALDINCSGLLSSLLLSNYTGKNICFSYLLSSNSAKHRYVKM